MKITFILDTVSAWQSGIWWHRNQIPAESLGKRGHTIRQIVIGSYVTDEQLDWPDVVVFGRVYPSQYDPIKIMRQFKQHGKRVVYDLDDDIWTVEKDNPSSKVSNALKDQYEGMMEEADVIISPSHTLLKKIKKHFKKPTFIAPNGINDSYMERPKTSQELRIGYMGAASHWKDLQLIGEVISELNKKYDFRFFIYGITGEPLEAAIYAYNKILRLGLQPEKRAYHEEALKFYNQVSKMSIVHVPFMPPELHAKTLAMCDLDIGIAPLQDSEFNRCKSNIKFYEYVGVGTTTIASDVLPYSEEVNYRAKNTFKDWYKKLEKLIIDEDFRKKIFLEQQKFVNNNHSLDAIGLMWELALQKQGGLKVKNQQI